MGAIYGGKVGLITKKFISDPIFDFLNPGGPWTLYQIQDPALITGECTYFDPFPTEFKKIMRTYFETRNLIRSYLIFQIETVEKSQKFPELTEPAQIA